MLVTCVTFAQNAYTLRGEITDSSNGTPVNTAEIKISNGKIFSSVTSDNEGKFTAENIPFEQVTVTVSRIGYEIKTEIVPQPMVKGKDLIYEIKIFLKPRTIETGEIRVISTRRELFLKNVPLPLDIIGSEQIQRTPVQTLPEIMSTKSGISLIRDGIWATDVSIRGLSKFNVVTLIDGNRIETATDLSARLSMFDATDIDRIEVIKGGASSIYGTGATGGVINILTKQGFYNSQSLLSGSFTSSYNSVNNSPLGKLALSFGSERFYTRVSGMLTNADNIKTPQGELKNSQYSAYNLSASVGFKPFENHEIKIDYQNYYAKDVGIPGASLLFPVNAVVRYPQERRQLYSAEYKINDLIKPLQSVSVKYYYQYILRDVENIPNQVVIRPATGTTPKQRISVLSIYPNARHYTNGIEMQTDWKIAENNFLIAGIDVWQRTLDSRRERNQKIEVLSSVGDTVKSITLKTFGERPIPESDYLSMGVYAQDEFRLVNDKLKFMVGGRVDKINVNNADTYQPVYEITNGVYNPNTAGKKLIWAGREESDVSWSANAGILYSLLKDVDLTLNVSRSFRSPSLEERYQYIDLGNFVRVGNPDLNPEQSIFLDLGMRVWKQDLSFTGNIFLNTFKDLVTEIPGTYENRPAFIKTNVGEAALYGFDLEVMYNFYQPLVGYVTASYVRGEDTGNNTSLPQIPPFNGRIGLRGQFVKWFTFDVNAAVFDRQEKIAAGEIGTPGYATFNLNMCSIPVNLKYTTLKFFAGIENILDKSYRNHLSSNRGLITAEPGRNFYFKLNLNF
ncbi:MAG: TonB-dependent receptor [Ignavibacteria bacterium]|nr:TonB-dependent receptor [Ignavibacteria bacterium]